MSKIKNISSGDIFSYYFEDISSGNFPYEQIKNEIRNNPTISQCYRLFLLNPDESIRNEIPQEDLILGGSYSENYQNGQRRSLSFSLFNRQKKYTPSINGLWTETKFKLEVGLEIFGQRVWFPKGIYAVTNLSTSYEQGIETVNVETGDKFSILEGQGGTIDLSHTIPVGTDIYEAIVDTLKLQRGNGQYFDAQSVVYDSAFKDKKTQAKIEKESGSTIGSIILELATQLNAEVFYNTLGQLTFVPINSVTNDVDKPILFDYHDDISSLNLSFDLNSVINKVVVLGSTANSNYIRAEAVNDNAASPLCYQRIGYRVGQIINDNNITSKYLAQDRADYELRQNLILKSSCNMNARFNPLLMVNNLITITNDYYGLNQARFLIQGISFSLDFSGTTSLTISNVENFSFLTGGR